MCEMILFTHTHSQHFQLSSTQPIESLTEAEHKVKGRFLLDVVVLQGTTILQLLACEDETLLVWRNALLVLDLGLDGVDGVAGLDLEGDGLSSEGLDEDLHVVLMGSPM